MRVSVKIILHTKSDPYARYITYTVDKDIPPRWREWDLKIISARRRIIQFVTDLPFGRHFIAVGVSCPCKSPYFWDGEIYVNNKKVASGKICIRKPLKGYFSIGIPEPEVNIVPIVVGVAIAIGGLILLTKLLK